MYNFDPMILVAVVRIPFDSEAVTIRHLLPITAFSNICN